MTDKPVRIGRNNHLRVVDLTGFGAFLDGAQFDEILLPKRFVPSDCKIGDSLDVFVYLDSDDRLIATTEHPFALVGEFAYLKVKQVNPVGAFLDWNLQKDLLAPFSEQKIKMQEGDSYVVHLYQDEQTRRIVASSKLNKFLDKTPADYKNGQEVSLLIFERTDLGYMAIINNHHQGLIFESELDDPVRIGKKLNGYIKRIRPDGKIDLSLKKPGFDQSAVSDLGRAILDKLDQEEGFLPMNDRTDPELIKIAFGVSKRVFKMALGGLYKQHLITIEDDGIRRFEEAE